MEPTAATAVAIAAVVFGLKRITFLQALGILILASILTGGHRIVSTDVTSTLPKRSHAAASAFLG